MAFDINGLSEIRALARNRYVHAYDTTDDLSTVLASGYFDGGWYRLGARDRLDIEASDGRIMAVVSAASAAGVTITASTDLIPANALGTGSVARSVEDELKRRVYIEQFGADPTNAGLANTIAIQKCVNFCKNNGIKECYTRSGTYLLAANDKTFALPADDGTVYPGWIGTDHNLPAETTYSMSVCVEMDDVTLIGNGEGTIFAGAWDKATGSVNTAQEIGFKFTNPAGKNGVTQGALRNCRVHSFFIGVIGEGFWKNSLFDRVYFNGCGISMLWQGSDYGFNLSNIKHFDCYAPLVACGWWLYRSNTQYTLTYIPPYPATDTWLSGAGDFFTLRGMEAIWNGISYVATTGIAPLIDAFFNTYFFKSANSPLTVYTGSGPYGTSAGRLSITADGTVPAQMHTYRGITGWGLVSLSRYGRINYNPEIIGLKTRGAWRGSRMIQGAEDGESLSKWYSEATGYAVPITAGGAATAANTLGHASGVTDPYTAAATPKCALIMREDRGTYPALTRVGPQMRAFTYAPTFIDGPRDAPSVYRWNVTEPIHATAGIILGNTVAYNNTLSRYDLGGTFTPTFFVGATEQTISTKLGTYCRIGSRIFFEIYFAQASGFSLSGTGNLTIGGFPASFGTAGAGTRFFMAQILYFQGFNGAAWPMLQIPGGQSAGAVVGTLRKFSTSTGQASTLTHSDLGAISAAFDLRICGQYDIG